MSWVLILDNGITGKPPAVIGGYPTRADAERAGDLAIVYDLSDKWRPKRPNFTAYTVIPGAACAEPVGSTHVRTWTEYDPAGYIGHCEIHRT